MRHCLDSWAVLAWLDGEEPAATMVDEALAPQRTGQKHRPLISWINLIEVEYRVWRSHGPEEASLVLSRLREIVEEDLPGVTRMRAVAELQATHPIALADCFAIATAASLRASLLTGNPEILDRGPDLPCEVVDARG